MISFEWDENKNQINQSKHNVDFEEAKTVFYDEDALSEYDEDRFRILGRSDKGNILLVVHCIRKKDVIRIISARHATNNEKKNYERSIGL